MKRPNPTAQRKAESPGALPGGRRWPGGSYLAPGAYPPRTISFAEPVSLSSTAPADLSPWPCGLLVRPSGSVSTYSRSVLGASGTLGRRKGPCKFAKQAVAAICELFCFPHFHSLSCSLWKTGRGRGAGVPRILRLDITP